MRVVEVWRLRDLGCREDWVGQWKMRPSFERRRRKTLRVNWDRMVGKGILCTVTRIIEVSGA